MRGSAHECFKTILCLFLKDMYFLFPGVSFRYLSRSKLVRKGLESLGYKARKSKSTIAKLVHQFADEVRDETRAKIQAYVKSGGRYTVVVDEWSCGPKKKRYLGVCLHRKGQSLSLGLKPINGSMPAKELEKLIIEKLTEYGVVLVKDVVAIACDGCSLMKKLGKNLEPINQQLCLAHCIHLAVTKCLYKTKTSDTEDDESDMDVSDDESDTSSEVGSENELDSDGERLVFVDDYRGVLYKLRSAIAKINFSPIKLDILRQAYFLCI